MGGLADLLVGYSLDTRELALIIGVGRGGARREETYQEEAEGNDEIFIDVGRVELIALPTLAPALHLHRDAHGARALPWLNFLLEGYCRLSRVIADKRLLA